MLTISANIEREDDTISFTIEGEMGFISLMPAPIPFTDLEGPCATAWWWPEATEKMKNHKSHLIVTLTSGGNLNPFQKNLYLSWIVASIASVSKTAGIYWGNGTLVYQSDFFADSCKEASLENLHLPLWIDFRVEKNDDSSLRFFTTGMNAFGEKEIEIKNVTMPTMELLELMYQLADYFLTSPNKVKDGDTIGKSATEKIKVTYGPSMFDKNKTVIILKF